MHVPVSTHRTGVVKCSAHQRAEASGFIAVWSTVVCLQALEMFELDLLEHIRLEAMQIDSEEAYL